MLAREVVGWVQPKEGVLPHLVAYVGDVLVVQVVEALHEVVRPAVERDQASLVAGDIAALSH